MTDLKKKVSFLALAFFLSLAACDSEGDHLVPVGTKLPGGFTVNESKLFSSKDECLAYALKVQTDLTAKR
ncbi:MAG: hypothetical protein Q8K65_05705 [Alphaproteobacteria bacterium]|nr:hypothetical protein [Alphaproteobacteria bacterium]